MWACRRVMPMSNIQRREMQRRRWPGCTAVKSMVIPSRLNSRVTRRRSQMMRISVLVPSHRRGDHRLGPRVETESGSATATVTDETGTGVEVGGESQKSEGMTTKTRIDAKRIARRKSKRKRRKRGRGRRREKRKRRRKERRI